MYSLRERILGWLSMALLGLGVYAIYIFVTPLFRSPPQRLPPKPLLTIHEWNVEYDPPYLVLKGVAENIGDAPLKWLRVVGSLSTKKHEGFWTNPDVIPPAQSFDPPVEKGATTAFIMHTHAPNFVEVIREFNLSISDIRADLCFYYNDQPPSHPADPDPCGGEHIVLQGKE